MNRLHRIGQGAYGTRDGRYQVQNLRRMVVGIETPEYVRRQEDRWYVVGSEGEGADYGPFGTLREARAFLANPDGPDD